MCEPVRSNKEWTELKSMAGETRGLLTQMKVVIMILCLGLGKIAQAKGTFDEIQKTGLAELPGHTKP